MRKSFQIGFYVSLSVTRCGDGCAAWEAGEFIFFSANNLIMLFPISFSSGFSKFRFVLFFFSPSFACFLNFPCNFIQWKFLCTIFKCFLIEFWHFAEENAFWIFNKSNNRASLENFHLIVTGKFAFSILRNGWFGYFADNLSKDSHLYDGRTNDVDFLRAGHTTQRAWDWMKTEFPNHKLSFT